MPPYSAVPCFLLWCKVAMSVHSSTMKQAMFEYRKVAVLHIFHHAHFCMLAPIQANDYFFSVLPNAPLFLALHQRLEDIGYVEEGRSTRVLARDASAEHVLGDPRPHLSAYTVYG